MATVELVLETSRELRRSRAEDQGAEVTEVGRVRCQLQRLSELVPCLGNHWTGRRFSVSVGMRRINGVMMRGMGRRGRVWLGRRIRS